MSEYIYKEREKVSDVINTNISELKKENKFYSFDIFDTLVTRRVAMPKGIFVLVQNVLKTKYNISGFVTNNFYNIRIGAEECARHRAKTLENRKEITFDEIYSIIQSSYNLSIDECQCIKFV